uniref:Uncharacterized protein n=1 Tax=Caenorhabditis tropicalis TaxID=1561998 RepID=A0A1I7U9C5_9PELO
MSFRVKQEVRDNEYFPKFQVKKETHNETSEYVQQYTPSFQSSPSSTWLSPPSYEIPHFESPYEEKQMFPNVSPTVHPNEYMNGYAVHSSPSFQYNGTFSTVPSPPHYPSAYQNESYSQKPLTNLQKMLARDSPKKRERKQRAIKKEPAEPRKKRAYTRRTPKAPTPEQVFHDTYQKAYNEYMYEHYYSLQPPSPVYQMIYQPMSGHPSWFSN